MKVTGIAGLVVVVGVAGVVVGQLVRNKLPQKTPGHVTSLMPRTLLHQGDEFPDVTLSHAGGAEFQSVDLVGKSGAVVLFIDLECPPCTDMCLRWQMALDNGMAGGANVYGITNQTIESAEAYRAEHGLQFPIYRDDGGVFRSTYDVTRFPLEVVVGMSGSVRSTSYDSASPIDADALEEQLAQ